MEALTYGSLSTFIDEACDSEHEPNLHEVIFILPCMFTSYSICTKYTVYTHVVLCVLTNYLPTHAPVYDQAASCVSVRVPLDGLMFEDIRHPRHGE